MNIVAYGGGTNSTAMLIGLTEKGIKLDHILFADTGAEMPWTYAYIPIMNEWLAAHGQPKITVLQYFDENGNRLTLEEECLRAKLLPSKAYGFLYSKCSLKHKVGTQDKFVNNLLEARTLWKSGQRIDKFIGYDAGEESRVLNVKSYDISDKKYHKHYPLYEWDWYREDCIKAIQKQDLPLPGKSACYFCPSTKKREILELRKNFPNLYQRAINIEDNAMENLRTIKGLGSDYSWKQFVYDHDNQIGICAALDDGICELPCGCYDGE